MKKRNKIVLCGMLALLVLVLMLVPSVSAYQKKILVDLTHAERVSIDGVTSPNLDTSTNNRILNWTDWADYMRSNGYTVDKLTSGPVTSSALAGYNVLIVAQPDVTTSGTAYFTAAECTAIGTFVANGGGLLLMGTQLVGGSAVSAFYGDYDTVYHYPEIHNALLENLSIGMRFAEGMIGSDPYDVMAIGIMFTELGPPGNIWIHEGDKSHPIWDNVTDGKFVYWHGCSINVTDESIDIVATGDSDTYTSVKNDKYSPIVKPEGSYPVAIAAARYGTGKIVAYGDAGCWQGTTPFGDLFTKTYYNEQEIARNIIAYLTTAGYKPTVSISTDKIKYCSCETMTITINVANPTDEPVTFKWFLGIPQFSYWSQVYGGTFPAGYEDTIEVPLHVGEWGPTPFSIVWYADLRDVETGRILAADGTCCAYCICGKETMPVDIAEEMKKTIEALQ